jgi:hypothetical protein
MIDHVPDGAAGEAIDDVHAKFLGGAGGVFHLFGSALTHTFGFAIAPDVIGDDALVPRVDIVTYRLPDQMVADGKTLEAVLFQDVPAALGIAILGERPVDFKVIAPARQFQAIVTPTGRFFGNGIQCQVGPLAGKQSHRSSHSVLLRNEPFRNKVCMSLANVVRGCHKLRNLGE